MIRNENGLLAAYVYVDFDTSAVDVGTYVNEAKKAVATGSCSRPATTWSGAASSRTCCACTSA